MDIESIAEWVGVVITALPIVVTAASTIAAITPTPKDDHHVERLAVKLYRVIDFLALNIGRAKQK